MADEHMKRHWLDVAREARRQAHANVAHRNDLLDGVLEGCDAILLATEVIVDPNAKLAFVEELFSAVRHAASKEWKPEQLAETVRGIWEVRRGGTG